MYLNIENNLMIAISKKLGFQFPFNEEVKKADKMALEYEWENKVLKDNHVSFNSDEAKKFFLEEYYKLKRLQNA